MSSVTLGTGAKSFQQCLCTPPHRLTMRAGKCEACPAGASCKAGEAVKPQKGFWLPARDTPGKLVGSLIVAGLASASVLAAPLRYHPCLKKALVDVTGTGPGSVLLKKASAAAVVRPGDSTQIEFRVKVPFFLLL